MLGFATTPKSGLSLIAIISSLEGLTMEMEIYLN